MRGSLVSGGISLGLNKRRNVLFARLRGISLDSASLAVLVSVVDVTVEVPSVGGTTGNGLSLVSEPSGLREILSNWKGSTEEEEEEDWSAAIVEERKRGDQEGFYYGRKKNANKVQGRLYLY